MQNEELVNDQTKAAEILSNILMELKGLTYPGVSLVMIEEMAERLNKEAGAEPTFKGYKPEWAKEPFPSALCASIEFEATHAAPVARSLEEGTIIKYDLGLKYKSGCADACITVPVGSIDNRRQRGIRYCLSALYKGIEQVRAGVPISSIGKAIEAYCEQNGYQVLKGLVGHHIGTEMHQTPYIPNHYDKAYDGMLLKEGDVICIEPHITPGKGYIDTWKEDGWTIYAVDKQPVFCFEHMVLVTKDGYKILTTWDK